MMQPAPAGLDTPDFILRGKGPALRPSGCNGPMRASSRGSVPFHEVPSAEC